VGAGNFFLRDCKAVLGRGSLMFTLSECTSIFSCLMWTEPCSLFDATPGIAYQTWENIAHGTQNHGLCEFGGYKVGSYWHEAEVAQDLGLYKLAKCWACHIA